MKNKIQTALSVLFAIIMINAGLNKFFNYMPMPELSDEMMEVMAGFIAVKWILPLVAMVEIIAAILIVIPKTRVLGALVILPVMIGIVVHHAVHDVAGIGISLVLFAINIWVIAAHWNRLLPIIK
ncbi:DoxX family protein [Belliella sp. DSM 111904]|uniref:DoxX family protein n=1 Tax=Belliella filtrata TaxID=2923435 RepID=A0ABS9UZE1_9BACT|nr:DoxX family membrane protein [Belliella filtrata]MCH7409489.1 DoxX family protein [Belliella filtrata]